MESNGTLQLFEVPPLFVIKQLGGDQQGLTTIRAIPYTTKQATEGQAAVSSFGSNLADDASVGPHFLHNCIPEPQNKSTWSCEDSLIKGTTSNLATTSNTFVCSMVQPEHHHLCFN